jgi:hypothetical protein
MDEKESFITRNTICYVQHNGSHVATMERILGKRHEFTVASTMAQAEAKLQEQHFELIRVGTR